MITHLIKRVKGTQIGTKKPAQQRKQRLRIAKVCDKRRKILNCGTL